MKTGVLIVLSLSLIVTASACAQPGETRTSVCELAKAGDRMNGHQVRLVAVYTTDLLEHSSLDDRRCPKQYLEPDWTMLQKNARHDPSLNAFDKALYGRAPDYRELTQFSIDVSGKFVWEAGDKPHGTLIFEKIWSFKRLHGGWKKPN
jgi:hypothetical protein